MLARTVRALATSAVARARVSSVPQLCGGFLYEDPERKLRFRWKEPTASAPLRCLIVHKQGHDGILRLASAIVDYLHQPAFGVQCVLEKQADASSSPRAISLKDLGSPASASEVDFVVVLGGDGTLLHAQSLFQGVMPPTIGFSCGSLGFLLPFDPVRYKDVLRRALAGELELLARSRLQFHITSKDEDTPPSGPLHVLNEVALKRAHEFAGGVQEIVCAVDGVFLAKYQGDGVLVASPTGSSAYSMASGGSIVHPSIDCLMVTPLCSMTLSSRPVILPGSSTISLTPTRTTAFLEGRWGQLMPADSTVHISRSPHPLYMFTRETPTKDWVKDLGSKLLFERQVRVERTFLFGGQSAPDPQSIVLVRSPPDDDEDTPERANPAP